MIFSRNQKLFKGMEVNCGASLQLLKTDNIIQTYNISVSTLELIDCTLDIANGVLFSCHFGLRNTFMIVQELHNASKKETPASQFCLNSIFTSIERRFTAALLI